MPLKTILAKLTDKEVTNEQITTILQLLIHYAETEEGAYHLSKMQVLHILFKANIMQRLNEQDMYISKQL